MQCGTLAVCKWRLLAPSSNCPVLVTQIGSMVGVMGSPGGSSKEVEKKGLGSGGVLLGAALVLGFTLWTTHLDVYWLGAAL